MKNLNVWLLCAVMGGAGAANAATLEVIGLNQGEATSSAFELSINDQGTVAYEDFSRPAGTSASSNTFGIVTVDVQGQTQDIRRVLAPVAGTVYQSPIHNDAGQTLVVTSSSPASGGTYQELAIIEPDGTKIVIGERLINGAVDRPGIPNFNTISPSRIAFNDAGEAAASVTATNGLQQIVRFPSGGGSPEVMHESSGSATGIFNVEGIDINNAGQVVFIGTELGNPDPRLTTTTGVYVTDGTTTDRVVTADGFTIFGRPTINDNGDVAAPVIDGTDAGYILQEAGGATATPTIVGAFNTSGASVSSLNLNDYGQVAYEYENSIFVDGELILAPGDRLDGVAGEITTSFPHLSLDLRPSYGLNNLGQVAIGAGITPDNPPNVGLPYDTSAIVRYNPDGATPDNPLLPFASTPEGENDIALNIFNGLGVEAPIWVDPIVATGFTYTQGLGGENFASLTLPGVMPLTQSVFDLSFDYTGGSFFGSIAAGEMFDFLAYDVLGISSFTISGIDVAEAVDPTDPFVVGLTFVQGGFQSVLSIDATTFDTDNPGGGGTGGGGGGSGDPSVVPLPASGVLLLAGLFGLAVVRRHSSVLV